MEISSKIVADSILTGGHRVITFEVVYPFIIHGEVMTHRMFSRNASSARAIPYHVYEKSVMVNPVIPIDYQQEHTGMQGDKYIAEEYRERMDDKWLYARDQAVKSARNFNRELYNGNGVDLPIEFIEGTKPTKQLANRILQPYSLMRVIITVGYDEGLTNFFKLRDHKDAEIHIQQLAKCMIKSVDESKPRVLKEGEWHIPYESLIKLGLLAEQYNVSQDLVIKASTGKVARISYTAFPNEKKIESYLRIHDMMCDADPFHASAFEHVIQNMTQYQYDNFTKSYINKEGDIIVERGWCANIRGGIQYRYLIENDL